jgi:hypothetical protein
MTEAEIEAELGSLRARLLQLEQEQDYRKTKWGKLWRVSLGAALAFAAMGLGFLSLDVWDHISGATPMRTPIIFVVAMGFVPLVILTHALRVGHPPQ